MMRNSPVVSLVVLMGLPFSALADPQLSGQSLGVLEGTVARCAELDPKSVEQLQHLRKLSRLSKDQLTFSVTGPDGVAVHSLSAEVLNAFLSRLK